MGEYLEGYTPARNASSRPFRDMDFVRPGINFEQFAWDLAHRGVSNLDIPVLILGVDA